MRPRVPKARVRGGQRGAGQMHAQREARTEISTDLVWRRGVGLTNNKLKDEGWGREGFCKVMRLADSRWVHGPFKIKRFAFWRPFLMKGCDPWII